MPAYFDLTFSYKYENLHTNFVNQIYTIFFDNGFAFKQVDNEENTTLEEIITWNQSKLEKKFKLGYTQTREHDYKQLCFSREGYEEIRAFWSYSKNEIILTVITPEYDVLDNDCSTASYRFIKSKLLPFLELSIEMWEKTDVLAVQTSLEFDEGSTSLVKLYSGKEQPIIHPFAIIKSAIYKQMSEVESHNLKKEGILLVDNSLINK